jgi:lipopolysaccharide cholinephosphotransferase
MEHANLNTEIDFPTTPDYSKEQVRKVQLELFDMARITCEILERHNIPYFISFGTLLGAVRHKGFVPWDDDFDLFLFEETYDEAMSYLEKELPEHLLVHSIKTDPIYFPAWNIVRNLRTEVVDGGLYNQDNNLLKYKCIGLDMYRMKKVENRNVEIYKIEEAKIFFKKKFEFGIISEAFYSDNITRLDKELEQAIINREKVADKSMLYSFIFGLKKSLLHEQIFPLKRYRFEGVDFWGPSDSNAFLESTYGNYLEIPSYEKRKGHFDKVVFKQDI